MPTAVWGGRGVGLDVVHQMVVSTGGTVRVESRPGSGTTFGMVLPVTLSVLRAALVEIAGESYAFPLARTDRVLRAEPEQITPVQGRLRCLRALRHSPPRAPTAPPSPSPARRPSALWRA